MKHKCIEVSHYGIRYAEREALALCLKRAEWLSVCQPMKEFDNPNGFEVIAR